MDNNRMDGCIGLSLVSVSALCILFIVFGTMVSADSYVGGIVPETVQTGVVSGDLFMDATTPSWGQNDVTKRYSLPVSTEIRWARLYVVVYCGHMQNNYPGTVKVSFDCDGDGSYETVLGDETLNVPYTYPANDGTGPVMVNSHTTRVTSDYVMWYDVTSKITSRNPGARVETAPLDPKVFFDGRIKAITLLVAYDDGDSDQVWYAVNQGHDVDSYYTDDYYGEDYKGETSFDTSGVSESVEKATLSVNHMASQDGLYRFNGEDLIGGQYQGAYFGSNNWDVTDIVKVDGDNLLTYDRYGKVEGVSEFSGLYYKIILATLTIRQGKETPESEETPDEDDPDPTSSGSTGSDSSDSSPATSSKNGYYGLTIPAAITGTVNGSVNIYETSDYSGLIPAGKSKTYTLQVPLPANDTVQLARLSVYTTQDHDEKKHEGLAAPLALQYDGSTLSPTAKYLDRKGFGDDDYPVSTFTYDISDLVKGPGTYSFSVKNGGKADEAFAVYGLVLVLVHEAEGGTPTMYWIAEGSDLLLADPKFATSSEDATTHFTFEGIPSGASAARLSLISTNATGTANEEHRITFNGAEWRNLLTNGSSAISIGTLDVLESLRPGSNEATIESSLTLKPGDYLENRGAVLVIVPGGNGLPSMPQPDQTSSVRVKRTAVPTVTPTVTPVTTAPPSVQKETGFIGWLTSLFSSPTTSVSPAPGEPVYSVVNLSPEVNLRIMTDPDGASVMINGEEYVDLTPLTCSVSRGETQDVTITLDGYDPYRTSLTPSDDYDLHLIFTPYVPRKTVSSTAADSDSGGMGGVYVESYPKGATILIDGRATDQVTPHVAYGLREGFHTVGVKKTNTVFPPARRVYVTGGAITRVMFPEGVSYSRILNITSEDYADSSFTVNGRGPAIEMPGEAEAEGTPAYIVLLHEGAYLSRTVLPQKESGDTMVIRSEPSDTQLLTAVITSDPPGSEIIFDGFPTGLMTPAAVTNVSKGLHRVTVQAPGYLPEEKELMMIDAINNPIDEKVFLRLEPYVHGSLNLTSNPAGAKVYLSGRNTGEKTPVVIPSLPIGLYTVKLVGEDESRTYDVVITPGEEKSICAMFLPEEPVTAVLTPTPVRTGSGNATQPSPSVTAAFRAAPLSGAAPLQVQFFDESQGSVTSWSWDFDNDGTADSTEKNPKYIYPKTGTYTVTLTAKGPQGSDTLKKSGFITVTSTTSRSNCDLYIGGNPMPIGGVAFALEPNTVKVFRVGNNGPDTSPSTEIELKSSDGFVGRVFIPAIKANETITAVINDTTIRSSVGGKVTYTATIDPDNKVIETNEENNEKSRQVEVRYNGYKGAQFWTGKEDIETVKVLDLHGDIVHSFGDSEYRSGSFGSGWNNYTVTWTADQPKVPGNAKIREVRLYVPYTWDNAHVAPDKVSVEFNGETVPYQYWYHDVSNFGAYWDHVYGLLTYNVTDQYKKNAINKVIFSREGDPLFTKLSMYGFTLAVIYEDPGEPRRVIFLNEGFDLLGASEDDYGTTEEEATGYIRFSGPSIDISNVKSADLITFVASGAAQEPGVEGEGNLIVNGKQIGHNVWDYGGSTGKYTGEDGTAQVAVDIRDIREFLVSNNNEVGVQSTAGFTPCMAPIQTFLVLTMKGG